MYRYYREKLHVDKFWALKGLTSVGSVLTLTSKQNTGLGLNKPEFQSTWRVLRKKETFKALESFSVVNTKLPA